jgi:hypothetical protein
VFGACWEGAARGNVHGVNRTEFEGLRDLADKVIRADIRFSKRQATMPALIAEGIAIENSSAVDLRLNITFNPEVGSKTFNVHVPGLGPVCRMDVDGPAHRPAGRSHKHALLSERCPERNLRDGVSDRPDLSGRSVRDLFDVFCELGNIRYEGTFESPDAT